MQIKIVTLKTFIKQILLEKIDFLMVNLFSSMINLKILMQGKRTTSN